MLASLLMKLGLAAMRGEVSNRVHRVLRQAAFGTVTALLALLAFGFGLAALTVWLASELGAAAALAVVAAGALVLALVVHLVGAWLDRQPRRRRPARIADIPPAAEAASARAGEPPAGTLFASLAVVAGAGFLLARQFFRRRSG